MVITNLRLLAIITVNFQQFATVISYDLINGIVVSDKSTMYTKPCNFDSMSVEYFRKTYDKVLNSINIEHIKEFILSIFSKSNNPNKTLFDIDGISIRLNPFDVVIDLVNPFTNEIVYDGFIVAEHIHMGVKYHCNIPIDNDSAVVEIPILFSNNIPVDKSDKFDYLTLKFLDIFKNIPIALLHNIVKASLTIPIEHTISILHDGNKINLTYKR